MAKPPHHPISAPRASSPEYTARVCRSRGPLLQRCPLRQGGPTLPPLTWQVPSGGPPGSHFPSSSARVSRLTRKQLCRWRKSVQDGARPRAGHPPASSFPLPPAPLLPGRSRRHGPGRPTEPGPRASCPPGPCAFAQDVSPLSRRPGRPHMVPAPARDTALLRPLQRFANIANSLLPARVPDEAGDLGLSHRSVPRTLHKARPAVGISRHLRTRNSHALFLGKEGVVTCRDLAETLPQTLAGDAPGPRAAGGHSRPFLPHRPLRACSLCLGLPPLGQTLGPIPSPSLSPSSVLWVGITRLLA